MTSGIVGYGAYVPYRYIKATEIDKRAEAIGLEKKAIATWDEDSLTMAVEAGVRAIRTAKMKPDQIGAVYIGSESPPYAVKPSSTILADILGVSNKYQAVDLQFACKAATAGVQMALAQVQAKQIEYGLVIGADKSQARPGDVLEWSAGAAAAALILGHKQVIAEIEGIVSVSSDTPDFWRREHQLFPEHAGRFSGEPAYFKHVMTAAKEMMKQMNLLPVDFRYVVCHMPNGKFPVKAACDLGFTAAQWETGLTVKEVGNPYSASAMLGLVAVLEKIKPGERVLVTAYGSGAGADSMVIRATNLIDQHRWGGLTEMFKKRQEVGLDEYLRENYK